MDIKMKNLERKTEKAVYKQKLVQERQKREQRRLERLTEYNRKRKELLK
jgi:hypothetical protein